MVSKHTPLHVVWLRISHMSPGANLGSDTDKFYAVCLEWGSKLTNFSLEAGKMTQQTRCLLPSLMPCTGKHTQKACPSPTAKYINVNTTFSLDNLLYTQRINFTNSEINVLNAVTAVRHMWPTPVISHLGSWK